MDRLRGRPLAAPRQPPARLLQRLLARGGRARRRAAPAAQPRERRPGADDGGLADGAVDLRHLRARQRDPAGRPGDAWRAAAGPSPPRREPLAVPVAPRRRDCAHPGGARRAAHDLDELGRQPILRGPRRRPGRRGRGGCGGAPCDRGGDGPARGRGRPLVHTGDRDERHGPRDDRPAGRHGDRCGAPPGHGAARHDRRRVRRSALGEPASRSPTRATSTRRPSRGRSRPARTDRATGCRASRPRCAPAGS